MLNGFAIEKKIKDLQKHKEKTRVERLTSERSYQKREKLTENYNKRVEKFLYEMIDSPYPVQEFEKEKASARIENLRTKDNFVGRPIFDTGISYKSEKTRIRENIEKNKFYLSTTPIQAEADHKLYRARDHSKEIQPPLKFKANTDFERVMNQFNLTTQDLENSPTAKKMQKSSKETKKLRHSNSSENFSSLQTPSLDLKTCRNLAKEIRKELHQKTHFQAIKALGLSDSQNTKINQTKHRSLKKLQTIPNSKIKIKELLPIYSRNPEPIFCTELNPLSTLNTTPLDKHPRSSSRNNRADTISNLTYLLTHSVRNSPYTPLTERISSLHKFQRGSYCSDSSQSQDVKPGIPISTFYTTLSSTTAPSSNKLGFNTMFNSPSNNILQIPKSSISNSTVSRSRSKPSLQRPSQVGRIVRPSIMNLRSIELEQSDKKKRILDQIDHQLAGDGTSANNWFKPGVHRPLVHRFGQGGTIDVFHRVREFASTGHYLEEDHETTEKAKKDQPNPKIAMEVLHLCNVIRKKSTHSPTCLKKGEGKLTGGGGETNRLLYNRIKNGIFLEKIKRNAQIHSKRNNYIY